MSSYNSDSFTLNDALCSDDPDRMLSALEKLLQPKKLKKDRNQNCFSRYFCCFTRKNNN